MSQPVKDFDGEHPTRPDDSIAVNEAMDADRNGDEDTTVEVPAPPQLESLAEREARRRHNNVMTQALLAALSTGQIDAVSGAASLRKRGRRGPTPFGPRSQLSHDERAPQRIVSVSSLRALRRRKSG